MLFDEWHHKEHASPGCPNACSIICSKLHLRANAVNSPKADLAQKEAPNVKLELARIGANIIWKTL